MYAVGLITWALAALLHADGRCAGCHPKEVAGYASSSMAKSLAPVATSVKQPDGAFEHAYSGTRFFIRNGPNGMVQSMASKGGETEEKRAAFVVGSGSHAFGYLIQTGDHLFQSPLSFYTDRRTWDMAPGYERDPHPDFTRPVTPECLFCHAGKALPIPGAVNRYQAGVFAEYGIGCERCHGDPAEHLKKPAPGSIVNPAKLTGAARASVCEQCHLVGETRIANPGRQITDFRPGTALETGYTTYTGAGAEGEKIKVVGHSEQLALSLCARRSGGKLWCGTCHNPHEKPAEPAAFYRERCLTCHAATLEKTHAAPGRDCAGCHMPKAATRDGGHTAFTNHRIARPGSPEPGDRQPETLVAWREPEPRLQQRNLALALVANGFENGNSAEVIRGYRLLNRAEKDFPDDAALLASLGTVLLKGKQPEEALKRFEKAAKLNANYPPYRMNVALALAALGRREAAIGAAREALALDPLFEPARAFLRDLP